ncbi:MAG TPA: hypothetical protein VHP35_07800, partial [Terriglobia bacterium]|nr:hypothetical protein [Terriglobia bacterium]
MSVRLPNGKLSTILLLLPFAFLSIQAAQERPAAPAPASLRLFPGTVTLWGARASQQFVVLGQSANGLEQDVTSTVHFSLSDAEK